jgi:protein-disulfide isomerase
VSEVCQAAGTDSETCRDVKSVTEALSAEACGAIGRDLGHARQKLADRQQNCDRLANRLCADIGRSSGVCQNALTDFKRFPAERCTLMLAHYPEVVAEARGVEEAQRAFVEAHQPGALAGVPMSGPADAKVTLVEFSDFECSECARGFPLSTHIRNVYGRDVRFVFRQFPLRSNPHAHLAAEASLAAQAQGKFWEYHDILFSNQHDLSRAALERYAQAAGLDLPRFRRALDQAQFAAAVDRDLELGRRVSVKDLPALFVNGRHVDFPFDVGALSGIMDRALAAP